MPVVAAIAPPSLSPEQILQTAAAAEDAGIAELWLWEDSFFEGGIAMSAAVLGRTDRLRVGIGVLPVPFRNVALAAMEIAALDRAFPGRFVVGLGHGVQEWMGQAGVRARSPLTLMREYVTALRSLLAGEEVTVSGDYVQLDRVKLAWPPASIPLLHLGATGPKSLALSGEVGDGTVLVADTRLGDLPAITGQVAAGRRAAGRDGDHQITMFLHVPTGEVGPAVVAVRRWVDQGTYRVALQPSQDDSDPVTFVRFAAEVARRLEE